MGRQARPDMPGKVINVIQMQGSKVKQDKFEKHRKFKALLSLVWLDRQQCNLKKRTRDVNQILTV